MKISDLNQTLECFHQEVLQLVMNVIIDKTGNHDKDPFTIDMYRLRKNVLYRSSSLDWHLNTLLRHHESYEIEFKKKSNSPNILQSKSILFFIFDDLIFNIMSLYDYYANLIAYFLLGPNKQTIGWNSLAKSARGNKKNFSRENYAKNIRNHDHEWVARILDFRSKIIHRNIKEGEGKKIFQWSMGSEPQYKLLYSIPEELSKKLDLKSPRHPNIGVDLNKGSIEIVERSLSWLAQFTEVLRSEKTKNSIVFK